LTIAIVTVRSTPALTWLAVLLGLPAATLEIASIFTDSAVVNALGHSALSAFYFYTAYSLIAYMFEDSFVTKDELFAVGACFTVLLFAFASTWSVASRARMAPRRAATADHALDVDQRRRT
jgi:hypothetical protein